jgi:hypothetical protein
MAVEPVSNFMTAIAYFWITGTLVYFGVQSKVRDR